MALPSPAVGDAPPPPAPLGALLNTPSSPGFRTSLMNEQQKGTAKCEQCEERKRKCMMCKKCRKKNERSRSSSNEEDCKRKCPPSTQIIIAPPGTNYDQIFGKSGGYGVGAGGSTHPHSTGGNEDCSPKPLYCGGGPTDNTQTQVICLPPESCLGCQKQRKKKRQYESVRKYCNCCDCCGKSTDVKGRNQPEDCRVGGIEPATQQFLMYLQAFGLAASLLKDQRQPCTSQKEDHAHKEEEGHEGRQSKTSKRSKSTDSTKDKKKEKRDSKVKNEKKGEKDIKKKPEEKGGKDIKKSPEEKGGKDKQEKIKKEKQ